MEKFYKLVTNMNPVLSSDERVNIEMVENFILLFEKEIGSKILIDYDNLLDVLSMKLNVPTNLLEPFVEMYATAYFTMTNRRFVRICTNCRHSHSLAEIQECGMRDSAIIKTAIGIVIVDDKEDLQAIKN